MTKEQYLKNLCVPEQIVDVILDTDTYNEIDDQFALSYLMLSPERIHPVGICAAPFLNRRSISAADGMQKSFDEIQRLLHLLGMDDFSAKVYRGSEQFLKNELEPVSSDAASFLAKTAQEYSPEHPLYIVAIGAITNVASAILMEPQAMRENTVLVWLGGHSIDWKEKNNEFNMWQDVAAARIVFGCGMPLVQLPCFGVVSEFLTTGPELDYWIKGKNPLGTYLAESAEYEAESYAAGKPWSRVIWDVTAVAWLLNDHDRFMKCRKIPAPVPEYADYYSFPKDSHEISYVYRIRRDALFEDLFRKIAGHS